MFLWLVSWVAVVLQIAFAVLSLAAGLYYLAEVIEEYSVFARKAIAYTLIVVIGLYIGLLVVDGFPVFLVLAGILAHVCYGSLLSTFPIISLFSPGFIGGSVCLLVAHYLAFQHFATVWHPFQEVLAFFFLGLWLVPFAFFISLSANDLVLPTLVDQQPGGAPRKPRRSGFLALVDFMSTKLSVNFPGRSSKLS